MSKAIKRIILKSNVETYNVKKIIFIGFKIYNVKD